MFVGVAVQAYEYGFGAPFALCGVEGVVVGFVEVVLCFGDCACGDSSDADVECGSVFGGSFAVFEPSEEVFDGVAVYGVVGVFGLVGWDEVVGVGEVEVVVGAGAEE